MSDVVVIRPGCTDFDEQHRIQGTLDLPLNERGQEQVVELAGQLRSLPIETLYTGDCEPARSTAEALGRALGVDVKELEGLRNLDQGLWQGLPAEDVRRKYPKVYRQWQEDAERICPPEGEAVSDAVERIRKALHRPMKKRGMIGIVASEPLATLICCVVRGCRPVMPDPHSDPSGHAPAISILKAGLASSTPAGDIAVASTGTDGAKAINVASGNGVPANGSPVATAAAIAAATNGLHPVTEVKPS